MKTITFSSHMGPFAYIATMRIEPDVFVPLPFVDEDSTDEEKGEYMLAKDMLTRVENALVRGLADICFRATANEAMKALVKSGHLGIDPEDKAGKKPLPRDKAEYNDESVEVFSTAANDALVKMAASGEGLLPGIVIEVTGKYEGGESAASRKQAEKFLALYDAAPEAKKAAFAMAYGFDPEASREEIIEAVHAFHSSLRAPRKTK